MGLRPGLAQPHDLVDPVHKHRDTREDGWPAGPCTHSVGDYNSLQDPAVMGKAGKWAPVVTLVSGKTGEVPGPWQGLAPLEMKYDIVSFPCPP